MTTIILRMVILMRIMALLWLKLVMLNIFRGAMKDSQPLFCWRNIMNISYFQKFSLLSIFLVTFLTFTMPLHVLAATVTIGDVTTGEGGTMTFTANLDDNGNIPFTVVRGFYARISIWWWNRF